MRYAYRAIFLFNNKPAGRFLAPFGSYYPTRQQSYDASMAYDQLSSRRIMRESLTDEEYQNLVRDTVEEHRARLAELQR